MPDNRDHRTDEPATRCAEPTDGCAIVGCCDRPCGNLLPCEKHPQQQNDMGVQASACRVERNDDAVKHSAAVGEGDRTKVLNAGRGIRPQDGGENPPIARHSVEQGEQNGEACPCLCHDEPIVYADAIHKKPCCTFRPRV